jgi:hypothetical protein
MTSNLIHHTEYATVNTEYGFDLGLMRMFHAEFEWAERSTYRFEIEFFDRDGG